MCSQHNHPPPGGGPILWVRKECLSRLRCCPPDTHSGADSTGGATIISPDATHPQLSVKSCRGGGGELGPGAMRQRILGSHTPPCHRRMGPGGRGRQEGGGGGYWQLSRGVPRGGGAAHNYYIHTSRGCVCLGAWGDRGMYAIIAISRLCREESLKGLKDQRHSIPFN